MLLVVLSLPSLSADLIKGVAAATGLAAADLRMRLGGSPPRVLAMDADGGSLQAMADALVPVGLSTLVCDPACSPTDADRVVARRLQFDRECLTVFDAGAVAHRCPWSAIRFMQRGARETVEKRTVKSVVKKFDAGRALLTGGLSLSSKQEVTSIVKKETSERFVLLHRSDGDSDVMIYERQLDYRFLDRDMQASAFANLDATCDRLTAGAPHAPVDDRVGRPGFVRGLPATTVDPVDLGLYLVELTLRADASLVG